LRFSRKRQDGSAPIFFSWFRRKHFFITTCIKKHCTRPFKPLWVDISVRSTSLVGDSHSQPFFRHTLIWWKLTRFCLLFWLVFITLY